MYSLPQKRVRIRGMFSLKDFITRRNMCNDLLYLFTNRPNQKSSQMETQTASVKKIALPYGLILALSTIVLSVIVYVMGMTYDQPWWQSLLNFLLMTGCIVYGLKAFKKDNSGFLSLSDSLKVGLAIALIAGLIGSVFSYLFVTVIEPDFAVNMLEATRIKMLEDNPNMSAEQTEMALSMTEKMMSPGILVAFGIIASLFFGFIISLIAGLVMKNNAPENH
jgi:preprotein translocase subunit YajC